MNKIDIAELVELVEAGKVEQASQQLSEYLENLPSSEKGKVYVDLGLAYYQLMAENNEQLASILDEQLKHLKGLEKVENQLLEETEIDGLRSQLG